MPAPNLLCNYAATGTLAAATPANIDIPSGGARCITVVVKNTGATNAITAITYNVSPLGTYLGGDTTVTGTIAAGATLRFSVTDEVGTTLRVTLTSTSGTTYAVEAGGR